jgi:hypothetical protein
MRTAGLPGIAVEGDVEGGEEGRRVMYSGLKYLKMKRRG